MIKKTLVIGLTVIASSTFAILCPKCGNDAHRAVSAEIRANVEKIKSDNINITAKSAFLIECNSGKVLFTKDENKRLPIASMVKITTLAVVYDELANGNLAMSDKVMVSQNASGMGGSQAFLDFDSEYTVEELVKSIITASANDSCVALAEHIAGSEAEFVARMNALAEKLGMTNTHYGNCTGLPMAESYSCAGDVAKVYAYLMKNPFYSYKVGDESINKIWMYDLVHPSGRVTGLTNTNKHIRFLDGVVGGKTGYTAEAGHCITVSAQRGKMKPLAVIIGASDSTTRFDESRALLEHVFNGYENQMLVDATAPITNVAIKRANVQNVDLFPRESFFDLVKRGDKSARPTITLEVAEEITAPIATNTALGKIIVTDDGAVIREIDIVAHDQIPQTTYMDSVRKITKSYKF